jgi:hypothetical protein
MTAAILVIAGVVALSLLHTKGSGQKKEQSTSVSGVACPQLLLAADAYGRGDHDAFSLQIAQAARVAQDALQTSGEVFGEPERIALELHLNPKESSAGIERLLQLAVQECQHIQSQ